MRILQTSLSLSAVLAGALLFGGCGAGRTAPAELAAPAVLVTSTSFLGSPLGAGSASGVSVVPATQAVDLAPPTVTIRALARTAPIGSMGKSLGEATRLVISPRTENTVLPSTMLTAGCRLISGDEAGALMRSIEAEPPAAARTIAEERFALLPGSSSGILIESEAATRTPRLGILMSRRPPTAALGEDENGAMELAVTLTDLVAVPADDKDDPADTRSTDPASPPQAVMQRETVVVPVDADTSALVVLVPISFDSPAAVAQARSGPPQTLAVHITITPGSDDPQQLAILESTRTRMAESARRATAPALDPEAVRARSAVETAIAQAAAPNTDAHRRRASIVLLTSTNPAPVAADFATSADDAMLQEFVARISSQIGLTEPTATPDHWGLITDLLALSYMGELQSNNKLPPELESVLAIHTGEAGRHAGTLEELVKDVSRRSELESRLVAENFIYLEDNSPAARVRAYDWLQQRGMAPLRYDPLGTPQARRDALEQALTAATQPGPS